MNGMNVVFWERWGAETCGVHVRNTLARKFQLLHSDGHMP